MSHHEYNKRLEEVDIEICSCPLIPLYLAAAEGDLYHPMMGEMKFGNLTLRLFFVAHIHTS
eukprot:scaffold10118_cov75-Cyclotella_meneghiniana.AAC.1